MLKKTSPKPVEAALLRNKFYQEESVFKVENLLREAKRQKIISDGRMPNICILDPDGDLLNYLLSNNMAVKNPSWPCYHTTLYDFKIEGQDLGIIGSVVGAPFAVLVAEELFALGVELVIDVTSSGQILPIETPPYFILIKKALRDEGTSYHYLPPSDWAELDPDLFQKFKSLSELEDVRCVTGSSWTTDAPFRETLHAIDFAKSQDILSVEMEAAGLYAYAQASGNPVLCIAQVTNQMAQEEGDFEKGEEAGSIDALIILKKISHIWSDSN